MTLRVRRAVSWLTAIGTLTGCYSYRATALSPTPGTQVRILLKAAAPITTHLADQDQPTVHADVLELSGRMIAATADTLMVRLATLHTSAGPVAGVSGRVARVPVERVGAVTERRFAAGRTALSGAAVVLVASAVLLVWLVVTVTKAAGG